MGNVPSTTCGDVGFSVTVLPYRVHKSVSEGGVYSWVPGPFALRRRFGLLPSSLVPQDPHLSFRTGPRPLGPRTGPGNRLRKDPDTTLAGDPRVVLCL